MQPSSWNGFKPTPLLASLGMTPDEVAGFAEVAQIFGVTKRTARKYVGHATFPEPLGRLASGPVWRRADVEAWGAANLPLQTGRPRKRVDE